MNARSLLSRLPVRLKTAGLTRPLLAMGAVVVFFLLAPISFPARPRWFYYLVDLQHLPLFGGIAWWGASLLVKRGFLSRYAWGGALLGVSFLMELIQPLTGRYFEWLDLGLNACGIGLSLHWWSLRQQRTRRIGRSVICSLALLLLLALPEGVFLWDGYKAHAQFPVLCNFEGRLDAGRWEKRGTRLRRVRDPRGGASFVGEMTAVEADVSYPGIHLREAGYDWSGLQALLITVGVPGPGPAQVALRVDDRADSPVYADRFQLELTLEPGWYDLKIPKEDLVTPAGNALAFDRIYCLSFFFTRAAEGERVFIDNVRIMRSDGEELHHAE